MNIFLKNSQTGEKKQFKDGLKLKTFVQSLTPKKLFSSDDAIEHLIEGNGAWVIAYQEKEKFNLNY